MSTVDRTRTYGNIRQDEPKVGVGPVDDARERGFLYEPKGMPEAAVILRGTRCGSGVYAECYRVEPSQVGGQDRILKRYTRVNSQRAAEHECAALHGLAEVIVGSGRAWGNGFYARYRDALWARDGWPVPASAASILPQVLPLYFGDGCSMPVHDGGTAGGNVMGERCHSFLMTAVPGEDLDEWGPHLARTADGEVDPAAVLDVCRAMLPVLSFLELIKVAHGDLSMHNVLMSGDHDDGDGCHWTPVRAGLVDFGSEYGLLTTGRNAAATPLFAPPELVHRDLVAQDMRPAANMWSLGAILACLWLGRKAMEEQLRAQGWNGRPGGSFELSFDFSRLRGSRRLEGFKVANIIAGCMRRPPAYRLTCDDVAAILIARDIDGVCRVTGALPPAWAVDGPGAAARWALHGQDQRDAMRVVSALSPAGAPRELLEGQLGCDPDALTRMLRAGMLRTEGPRDARALVWAPDQVRAFLGAGRGLELTPASCADVLAWLTGVLEVMPWPRSYFDARSAAAHLARVTLDLPRDDASYAPFWTALANATFIQGDYEGAMAILRDVMAACSDTADPDPDSYALAWSRALRVACAHGDALTAEGLVSLEALTRPMEGMRDPRAEVAFVLALEAHDRLTGSWDAMAAHQRTCQALLDAPGTDGRPMWQAAPQDLAEHLYAMAVRCRATGDVEGAFDYLRRCGGVALRVRDAFDRKASMPLVMDAALMLCALRAEGGDQEGATSMLLELLHDCHRNLDAGDERTIAVLRELLKVAQAAGDVAAQGSYLAGLMVAYRDRGPGGEDFARAHDGFARLLGTYCRTMGRSQGEAIRQKARLHAVRALDVFADAGLPAGYLDALRAYVALGLLKVDDKDLDAAEKLMSSADAATGESELSVRLAELYDSQVRRHYPGACGADAQIREDAYIARVAAEL